MDARIRFLVFGNSAWPIFSPVEWLTKHFSDLYHEHSKTFIFSQHNFFNFYKSLDNYAPYQCPIFKNKTNTLDYGHHKFKLYSLTTIFSNFPILHINSDARLLDVGFGPTTAVVRSALTSRVHHYTTAAAVMFDFHYYTQRNPSMTVCSTQKSKIT